MHLVQSGAASDLRGDRNEGLKDSKHARQDEEHQKSSFSPSGYLHLFKRPDRIGTYDLRLSLTLTLAHITSIVHNTTRSRKMQNLYDLTLKSLQFCCPHPRYDFPALTLKTQNISGTSVVTSDSGESYNISIKSAENNQ